MNYSDTYKLFKNFCYCFFINNVFVLSNFYMITLKIFLKLSIWNSKKKAKRHAEHLLFTSFNYVDFFLYYSNYFFYISIDYIKRGCCMNKIYFCIISILYVFFISCVCVYYTNLINLEGFVINEFSS